MMKPRLMIAGTHSGAGKTTVTLGLMAALRRRGYQVQGFKVGPDYIDPSYHTAITGRPSRNLDPWMMGEAAVREVFHRGSDDCDIAVVEGVMGLFDGRDPRSDEGSAAHVSRLLDIPVILVMDAASMARSAAAVVLGFQQMQPTVPLAGVIPNRVGGQRHYELVETAISSVSSVPVFGYLTTHPELQLPERHLGLIPALERGELEDLFTALAAVVEETIDVDGLLAAARRAPALAPVDPVLFRPPAERPQVTVAIARDHAFNFYYPENLELLAWHGAELVEFRPLAGECIPDGADGVYFGGGFRKSSRTS
ncbi:hypothetical protein GCM10025857_01270 [Alicyclobacillus contaminans]|nr:hypothetical protein GCM10025857_01270 [Alicyclobacillus contaminans]